MGAVDFFKGLVGVFSFSSPTHAGKGEASAFNSPTKSQGYSLARLARELEPGLNVLFGAAEQAASYPAHCKDLLVYLKKVNRRVYLEEIMQELGKEKSTIHYEMCKLRKGGFKIKKTYVRSTGKFKYYLDKAA